MPEKTTRMRRLPSSIFSLIFFLSVTCLFVAVSGQESVAENLARELGKKQQNVADKKRIIKQLSLKERELHKDLAKIEKELDGLKRELDQQKQKASELEAEKVQAQKNYQELVAKMESEQKSLTLLMRQLWPVYLEQSHRRPGESWVEADQKFTWMQYFYHHSEKKMTDFSHQSGAVSSSLQELDSLHSRIEAQQEKIAAAKSNLQKQRTYFSDQVKKVRSQKVSAQEELDQIMRSLEALQHKMKSAGAVRLGKLKGRLPRPVSGQLKLQYNMKKEPPFKGLGFQAASASPVKAVAAGQVVHNDTLRGFGRVIILLHDNKYYSLYAFLSETTVKNGQKVNQGEVLGKCGIYPAVGGHGLYFELRFQQKPINPESWFIRSS